MDVIFLTTNQSAISKSRIKLDRPFGSYLLSHVLKKHNYSCQVIDFLSISYDNNHNISDKKIKSILDLIVTEKTKILGLSLTFWTNPDINFITEIINYVREKFPKIKILAGGAISFVRIKSFANLLDGYVQGYAENIILEYLDFLEGVCKEPMFELELPYKVKIYKYSSYKRFHISNYDFLHYDNDFIFQGESLMLESSRGCMFKCKFCDFQYLGKKKNDYIRDMNLIKNQLLHQYEKYKTTHYTLIDSTFNENVDKMKDFAEMIESLPFFPSFTAYIRYDLMARFPETIELIERCNIKSAFFGIETFNKKNSMLIGKGFNANPESKIFLEKISNRWSKKITIHTNFIVGLPYESEEEILNSKQFVKNIGIPSWAFIPLYIRSNLSNQRFSTSEFDRNAFEYGFTFDSNGNWVHKETNWSFERAKNFANSIFNYDDPNNEMYSVNPFHYFAPLITSGIYTIEDLVTKPQTIINWNEVKTKSLNQIDNYFIEMKNYYGQ
jgi:hypothetical protein